jgi:hypothetical protein
MNEMNSDTHSCIHSLASFAIFAFSGRADFMIRATGAKLRMLASESRLLLAGAVDGRWAGSEDEGGDEDDMAPVAARRPFLLNGSCRYRLRHDLVGQRRRETWLDGRSDHQSQHL